MSELFELKVEHFAKFFIALHGYKPFPWQEMLLKRCASGGWNPNGWPDLIDLPTASGKTACIDVAVFLLALQANMPTDQRTAARRIWFVVNRRIVVDEASERAKRIAIALQYSIADGETREILDTSFGVILKEVSNLDSPVLAAAARALTVVSGTSLPLAVARLRGGVPQQVMWSYHPAQPAVITCTVDQIGSRLLFRGYGVGKLSRSIHAALAGNDSLIILDEAHTANAFRQTVSWTRVLRRRHQQNIQAVRTPFHLVMMSATPPQDEIGGTLAVFPSPDQPGERAVALRDDLLDQRYLASKPAELVDVARSSRDADPLVNEAVRRAIKFTKGHRRVAVMVNRVATASEIVAMLKTTNEFTEDSVEVVFLTGRMRPIDRDELVERWSKHLKARNPEPHSKPIILVTTQCLEVGADFSFDALVTECASLDALRQRFGRLNRLGETAVPSPAVILIRADQIKEESKIDAEKPLDRVYDNALARTWNWVTMHPDSPADGKGKNQTTAMIDMGISPLSSKVPTDANELSRLLSPAPNPPIMLPAYLDLLCQTAPVPGMEPDISLFLHGPEHGSPEAFVVFRKDLDPDHKEVWADTVELMPPVTGEKLSVALWRLKKFLSDQLDEDKTSDMESERIPEDYRRKEAKEVSREFVLFQGKSEITRSTDPQSIVAGDTIVLPAPDEFPTKLGTPGINETRVDVYETAYRSAKAMEVIRIHPRIVTRKEVLTAAAATSQLVDKDALLELLGITDRKGVSFGDYPDKVGQIISYPLGRSAMDAELDPFMFDAEELLDIDFDQQVEATLKKHTERVESRANSFSKKCIPAELQLPLVVAAKLHDLGKADGRFQQQLNNGRRYGANELLAKSQVNISKARWLQLRELSGLQDNFRHEMLSVQLAAPKLREERDRDLILHLIASHHGHARPFAPIFEDDDPPAVDLTLDGKGYSISAGDRKASPQHRLDSGIAERFWELTRVHGWWGLAYLEALLRLADWRASKDGTTEDRRE